jgi:hypothetical protein
MFAITAGSSMHMIMGIRAAASLRTETVLSGAAQLDSILLRV